jgi:hypothetical protein
MPVETAVAAPGRGQCRGKQGFDRRMIAAPRGPLQRNDRLVGAVLHQQRASENFRRQGIAPV